MRTQQKFGGSRINEYITDSDRENWDSVQYYNYAYVKPRGSSKYCLFVLRKIIGIKRKLTHQNPICGLQ